MFRFEVAAPEGMRRENEATRLLRDFEIVLQEAGARPRRKGTSITFQGGLIDGWHHGGRVEWHDATESKAGRFVLTGAIWPELLPLVLGSAAFTLYMRAGLPFFLLVTAGLCTILTLIAGLRLLWLRGKFADLVRGVDL